MRTLAIDIGGTGIKALVLGPSGEADGKTRRLPTPSPATPEAVFGIVERLASELRPFDRCSMGFPGVVRQGVAYNAPNLGNALWERVDLAAVVTQRLGVPARAINDADLQGLGVVDGRGVELVLTLGTGLGAALFSQGVLVPNLELGQHPSGAGPTYEERICDAELKRLGKDAWSELVLATLAQLAPTFNYDQLHLGGGNLANLTRPLPPNTQPFVLADSLQGALRMWD